MNLGLRPSNFEFIYKASTLLKRDLLYFDQIHICTHKGVTIFDDLENLDPEFCNKMQNEFNFLKSHGLLCDIHLAPLLEWTTQEFMKMGKKSNPVDNLDLLQILEAFNGIPEPISPGKFKKKAL